MSVFFLSIKYKMESRITMNEIGKRIVKYFLEGLMVALAAVIIPQRKNGKIALNWSEIIMIALVASATFALLDLYAPNIGSTARQGAGFGLGATLVGFPAV
jgi:hypothetical protein